MIRLVLLLKAVMVDFTLIGADLQQRILLLLGSRREEELILGRI
jgi:hypothetical protein|tara:strand:+ start:30 stop:161 length:132 start_codon:yes stop_codon:yes gene_type:complete